MRTLFNEEPFEAAELLARVKSFASASDVFTYRPVTVENVR